MKAIYLAICLLLVQYIVVIKASSAAPTTTTTTSVGEEQLNYACHKGTDKYCVDNFGEDYCCA
jgi:hypothetical protein